MVKCKTEGCGGRAKTNGFCEDCSAEPWEMIIGIQPMISPKSLYRNDNK
ncbi:MAG: hypothetical protein KAI57_00800 [Candidatus Pacebacteria bacterium]|nr:hypothetical protein [Candidatus Paceibacterota bacterium]